MDNKEVHERFSFICNLCSIIIFLILLIALIQARHMNMVLKKIEAVDTRIFTTCETEKRTEVKP